MTWNTAAGKKKTKREEFLEITDEIIPWKEWEEIIWLYYPTRKRGWPPIALELMLRMYLLQVWFNLSDPGTEDTVYDSYAMRRFTGIDFLKDSVPDETTLCIFGNSPRRIHVNQCYCEGIDYASVNPLIFAPPFLNNWAFFRGYLVLLIGPTIISWKPLTITIAS